MQVLQIKESEMKSLICPNTQICPIYKMNYTDEKGKYHGATAKLDCITLFGQDYTCLVLDAFQKNIDLAKSNRFTQNNAECALIKLLNNSMKL
jgi:hypothetical protein